MTRSKFVVPDLKAKPCAYHPGTHTKKDALKACAKKHKFVTMKMAAARAARADNKPKDQSKEG